MAAKSQTQPQPMSEDTKTIITVLLLTFVYPVGLILMFVWTKWPKWVKALVLAPLIIGILFATVIGTAVFKAVKNRHQDRMNYNYSTSTSEESSSSADEFVDD